MTIVGGRHDKIGELVDPDRHAEQGPIGDVEGGSQAAVQHEGPRHGGSRGDKQKRSEKEVKQVASSDGLHKVFWVPGDWGDHRF